MMIVGLGGGDEGGNEEAAPDPDLGEGGESADMLGAGNDEPLADPGRARFDCYNIAAPCP